MLCCNHGLTNHFINRIHLNLRPALEIKAGQFVVRPDVDFGRRCGCIWQNARINIRPIVGGFYLRLSDVFDTDS